MAVPAQPAVPSGQVRRVGIAGLGRYVPDKVLTNQDLEKIVDTSDEWIVQRTGIRERRIAAEDQFTSTLAIEAAKQALIAGDVETLKKLMRWRDMAHTSIFFSRVSGSHRVDVVPSTS